MNPAGGGSPGRSTLPRVFPPGHRRAKLFPTPLFGAHMSIAGGFHKALEAAQAHGCDTVQLFVSQPKVWPVTPSAPEGQTKSRVGKSLTKSSKQWHARELTDEEVRIF